MLLQWHVLSTVTCPCRRCWQQVSYIQNQNALKRHVLSNPTEHITILKRQTTAQAGCSNTASVIIQFRLHCRANVLKLLYVQEAKQLEEARLKLAKEQKKKQDMEAAARLAVQRRAAEQAARQQVEAEMQKKRIDRQSRVCQPMHCNQWPYLQTQTSC